MHLKEGQLAPDFTVTDISNKVFKLSELKGKRIIIGFYRHTSCPFCNLRLFKIKSKSEEFRKQGIEMVFFFENTNKKLQESLFHSEVSPWPLIGDPEKKIYNLYGVERSILKTIRTFISVNYKSVKEEAKALNLPEEEDYSLTLMPADFFINEEFKIVKAHYGQHLDGHVPLKDLFDFAGIKFLIE